MLLGLHYDIAMCPALHLLILFLNTCTSAQVPVAAIGAFEPALVDLRGQRHGRGSAAIELQQHRKRQHTRE
jgi:hypothetical protein